VNHDHATKFEPGFDFPAYTSDAACGLYYVYFSGAAVCQTVDAGHGVYLDLDEQNRLVGVEVLGRAQGGWTEEYEYDFATESFTGPKRVWQEPDPE